MNRLSKLQLFGLRFPSVLSESTRARISRLFSGVRNSCDMLARNSVLYFDVRASCSSLLFELLLGLLSISRFFASTSRILLREQLRLFLQFSVRFLQFFGERLALLQQFLRTHRRRDRIEHDPDAFRQLIQKRHVNFGQVPRKEASSTTAFTSPSNSTGSTTIGGGDSQAKLDRMRM